MDRRVRRSPWGRILAFVALALIVWLAFVSLVPAVIKSAHGGALPLLSRIISPSFYPLERYLEHWETVRLRSSMLFALLLLGFSALMVPRVQEKLGARVAGSNPLVPRRRNVMAHVVLLSILASQLAVFAVDKEFWPFSNYFMFGGLMQPEYRPVRVWGVTSSGDEIYLGPQLRPYSPNRFQILLERSGIRHGCSSTPALDVLESTVAWYNHGVRNGDFSEPMIDAIRVYELTYRLDAGLANIGRPDDRLLLCEVRKARQDS